MGLQLSISSVDYGLVRVFGVKGYLAQLEVYRFKRMIEQALFDGKRILIADLSDTEFIDSAGIASLIFMQKESMKFSAQTLLVSPPQSGVSKVFAAASLGRFIQIYSTIEDALESRGISRAQQPDPPSDIVTQSDVEKNVGSS